MVFTDTERFHILHPNTDRKPENCLFFNRYVTEHRQKKKHTLKTEKTSINAFGKKYELQEIYLFSASFFPFQVGNRANTAMGWRESEYCLFTEPPLANITVK